MLLSPKSKKRYLSLSLSLRHLYLSLPYTSVILKDFGTLIYSLSKIENAALEEKNKLWHLLQKHLLLFFFRYRQINFMS